MLAVSIGVPVLLCYVYAVVPIALCRSDGCGVSAGENGGVRIDVDEEEAYRPVVSEAGSLINARGIITNPSIGEVRGHLLITSPNGVCVLFYVRLLGQDKKSRISGGWGV